MRFHRILCPIDFSPGSRQAMRVAVRLATEADAELVLLHTWYLAPTVFAGEEPFPAREVDHLVDAAASELAVAAREATALGATRVTSKVVPGVPWNVIVETAAAESMDLIVIGTHGRTGLSRVLLGSVAETVIRYAPCSVLAVPVGGDPKPFRHVLCAIDFSAHSRQALDLAAELVRPGGAGITLLHVLEVPAAYPDDPHPPALYRELDMRAAELLATWAEQTRAKVSAPVETRSRIGRPVKETLTALDADRTIDLVVMGSHGRTGIKRIFLGSVAEKVVRHAHCPVLVTRRS